MAAYADDTNPISRTNVVTNLTKGQKAPFTGILLSDIAAAKLFADLKFTRDECQLNLTKELQLNSIRFNAQIASLRLQLDTEKIRSVSLLQIKDQRIQYLEKNYVPPAWYESGEFWFAIGIISGIALTVGAGYAVSQAGK
jgi:hypothetical protein